MQVLRALQEKSAMSLLLALEDNNTSYHNTSPTRLSPGDTEKAKKIERMRGKIATWRTASRNVADPRQENKGRVLGSKQQQEQNNNTASEGFLRQALKCLCGERSLSLSLVAAPTRARQSRVGR